MIIAVDLGRKATKQTNKTNLTTILHELVWFIWYLRLHFHVYYFAGFFVTAFSISYLLSPKFCHRFVGYLEEEAVKTYTQCLKVLLFVVLEVSIKRIIYMFCV